MEQVDIKVANGTIFVNIHDGEQAIALPLDLAQQVDADQWLNDFRRQLRYACDNVGLDLDVEQQEELVMEIVNTAAVKQKIEHRNNAFWQNRTASEIREWFYARGFEDRPAQIPENTIVEDADDPMQTTNEEKKGNKIISILIVLFVLAAVGYFLWSRSGQPDVPPDPVVEENLLEDGLSALGACLKVDGKPDLTLKEAIDDEETYNMIGYPFERALSRSIDEDNLSDTESVRQSAQSIINDNLEKWEYRCNCKLINSCN